MQRLIMFFAGLALMGIFSVMIYFGGMMYNRAGEIHIEPYIMQPGNLSRDRVQAGAVPPENLSDSFMQTRLIKKFIHEYFYVIPDENNLNRRSMSGSTLFMMTSPDVFAEWKKVILPELEKYAAQNQMQTVHVRSIEPSGDYLAVNYDLIYNDQANRIDAIPKIENSTLYIMFNYDKGIREGKNGQPFDAGKWLESGRDPAGIFRFEITKVAI